MRNDFLAFDRNSARTTDADGRLHVAISNISKSCVNPYLGKEIPGYKELGLNADQVYQMLRDPAELERSAATFNNIPLLSRHVPVTVDDHQPDLVVGSTGTDASFEFPFLRNSLVVWEAAAIAGIESREQCELSSAYRYDPDMTSGEFEGIAYDGIMRNIRGNHVALVEIGRAGPDVVVSDENPFTKEKTMTRKEKKLEARAAALKVAQDAGIDKKELARILLASDADVAKEDDKDTPAVDGDDQREDESDEDYKKRMDAKKAAEDEDDEPAKPDTKKDDKAMDAAIAKARTDGAADAVKRIQAIHRAEKDVMPLIGEVVAQDSAEAVYKLALDANNVDTTGVHPSAYGAMVRMLAKPEAKPSVAMDASSVSDFQKRFPNAVIPARS